MKPEMKNQKKKIRTFSTGATRDTNQNKPDYEGFLSPLVIKRFGEYMSKHRVQSDGNLRDSDNWQKGIPKEEYMKSAWRHFMDWWLENRGFESRNGKRGFLCVFIKKYSIVNVKDLNQLEYSKKNQK